MEKVAEKGLAKAIGISNYTITQTELVLKNAKIVPAVNQGVSHRLIAKVVGAILMHQCLWRPFNVSQ